MSNTDANADPHIYKTTIDEVNESVVAEGQRSDTESALIKPDKVKKVPVMEIFGPTIQGEGFVAGTQTHFIRFGLCDYRCTMCDSLHAVDPRYVKANAKWMESTEILSAVADLPFVPWITLSGGNPAIHDLGFLVRGLQTMEFKVAVETQGTLSPSWINMLDAITISPKPPGMGEKFERDKFVDACHKFAHHPGFNIKIPVFSAQDLEFAAMIADIVTLFIHPLQQEGRMFLSLGNPYPPTLDGKTGSGIALGITGQEPKNTAELTQTLMECFELTAQDIFQHPGLKVYRFLPQLHVLVWGNARGK